MDMEEFDFHRSICELRRYIYEGNFQETRKCLDYLVGQPIDEESLKRSDFEALLDHILIKPNTHYQLWRRAFDFRLRIATKSIFLKNKDYSSKKSRNNKEKKGKKRKLEEENIHVDAKPSKKIKPNISTDKQKESKLIAHYTC